MSDMSTVLPHVATSYGPYGFGLVAVAVVVYIVHNMFRVLVTSIQNIIKDTQASRKDEIRAAVEAATASTHEPVRILTNDLRVIAEVNRATANTLERTVNRLEHVAHVQSENPPH